MFLNKVSLRSKAYLGLSFLLLNLLVAMYHFASLSNDDRDFVAKEIAGVSVITPLYSVFTPLIQYRVAYYKPELFSLEQIRNIEKEIEDSFLSVERLHKEDKNVIQLNKDASTLEEVKKLQESWLKIKDQFMDKTSNSLFYRDSSAFKESLIYFISSVGDKSNLILDPVMDSYYLMDNLVVQIPSLYDHLDRISQNLVKVSLVKEGDIEGLRKEYDNLVYVLKNIDMSNIINNYSKAMESSKNQISSDFKMHMFSLQDDFQELSNNIYQNMYNLNYYDKNNTSSFYSEIFQYSASLDEIDTITANELFLLLKSRSIEIINKKSKVIYINSIGILISLLMSYLVMTLLIVDPIRKLSDVMQKLMQNHIDIKIPYLNNKDEIGHVARAIENFRNSIIENASLIEQGKKKELEKMEHIERENQMEIVVSSFKKEISDIILSLMAHAGKFKDASKDTKNVIDVLGTKSNKSLSDSQEISNEVCLIDSLILGISSAVDTMHKQVMASNKILNITVNKVDEMTLISKSMTQHTDEICAVLELIGTVSRQINLLALNANIEASRAGIHGRGFAVVASEVKALAGKASKAAETISQKVAGINAISKSGSKFSNELKMSVQELKEVFSVMSSSIAEQNITTHDISNNMEKVSSSALSVTTNMKDLNTVFNQAKVSTDILIKEVDPVAGIVASLNQETEIFIERVKEIKE
jgi:methyl-accepting chemotaxis protein